MKWKKNITITDNQNNKPYIFAYPVMLEMIYTNNINFHLKIVLHIIKIYKIVKNLKITLKTKIN